MFPNHATMLEQHSESDWHRSSGPQVNSAFGFKNKIIHTIPKDASIIQYIIKISSVSQNSKPNVLEYQ